MRLFSPQVFIQELHEHSSTYTLTWDGSVLIFKNVDRICIGYHRRTELPVLRVFSDAMNTEKSLACIIIFSWHTRRGHLGFQQFQWIDRTGVIGNLGIKFGSTTVNPPPWDACHLGKQERTPKGNYCTENHDEGSIKVNQIKPGNLIFSDQYESHLEVLHFAARVHSLLTQKYRGGTLFCDAVISKVAVFHQVVLAGTENV